MFYIKLKEQILRVLLTMKKIFSFSLMLYLYEVMEVQ